MTRISLGMLVAVLTGTSFFLGFAADAHAFQGFRCGSGRLVEEGDQPPDIISRCGEPDFADSHEEKRTILRTVWTYVAGVPVAREEQVIVSVMVDEWTYDLGPNRFIRHLLFEQSRLVRVWTTGRGRKP